MQTIFELKEQAVTDTPLLVFDCVLPDGQTEHWSTHAVTVERSTYERAVLQHNVFELQAASRPGGGRDSADLAGAGECGLALFGDRTVDRMEGRAADGGFRVLRLAERRAVDGAIGAVPGDLQSAGRDSEATFRITATNRMNLQRLLLPQVRIQRRCPWEFPGDAGAAHGSDGRRRERQVFAVLPLRVLGRRDGRQRATRTAARRSRPAATRGRTARRAGCSRTSAESSLCRRRSRCGPTGIRTGTRRRSR